MGNFDQLLANVINLDSACKTLSRNHNNPVYNGILHAPLVKIEAKVNAEFCLFFGIFPRINFYVGSSTF